MDRDSLAINTTRVASSLLKVLGSTFVELYVVTDIVLTRTKMDTRRIKDFRVVLKELLWYRWIVDASEGFSWGCLKKGPQVSVAPRRKLRKHALGTFPS